jgi:DNA-directed RNA polymerase, alpha subunit/40 kD subunit
MPQKFVKATPQATGTRKGTGRPPEYRAGPLDAATIAKFRELLGDWQHALGFSKRTGMTQARASAVLRRGLEEGLLESTRSQPVCYRLVGAARMVEQPRPPVRQRSEGAISVVALRWLATHLTGTLGVDELRERSRTQTPRIVKFLKQGLEAGLVAVEEGTPRRYRLTRPGGDIAATRVDRTEEARLRLERHLVGEMSAKQLMHSLGVSRERVRQILEAAMERGHVETFGSNPKLYRMVQRPEPVAEVPGDTIADEAGINPAFLRPVHELLLSSRAANALAGAGIRFVGELVQRTKADLATLPNMGKRSIDEIVLALGDLGLELGMDAPAPPEVFDRAMEAASDAA